MSWEKKTISFVKQTSNWDKSKDHNDFLSYSISILKIFSEADVALKLNIEDKYTARVTDATPSFLNGLLIDPGKIEELFVDGIEILYWKEVFKQHNVFDEIMQALSSAVILPIERGNKYDLIILGWSLPQAFTSQLKDFFDVVKIRMDEIAKQSYLLTTNSISAKTHAAILERMPQAVVFIADDTYNSWVNQKAATLLQLDKHGILPSYMVSPAMGKFMTMAVNKADMNSMAMKLFSDPTAVLKDFKLQLDEQQFVNVSCYPIIEATIKGKLWLFE